MQVAGQMLARVGGAPLIPPRSVKRGVAAIAPWLDRLDRGLEAQRACKR